MRVRDYDYLIRMSIVGDSAVGKSSLVRRFSGEEFIQFRLPTLGK